METSSLDLVPGYSTEFPFPAMLLTAHAPGERATPLWDYFSGL